MLKLFHKFKFTFLLLFLVLGLTTAFFLYKRQSGGTYDLTKTDSTFNRPLSYLWGDPAKEMFPDISKPEFVSVKEADKFLQNSDRVFVVRNKSPEKVYPVNILSFHHIVNDSLNNEPVAFTFCLLTDTIQLFSRKLGDKTVELGVLGPLYFGNLVMYEKVSDAYFIQLTGEAISGKYQGETLKQVPYEVVDTTWGKLDKTTQMQVLAPVQEISFYRNFYGQMKESKMGLNSLEKAKTVDSRLDPYVKGIGLIEGNETKFIPVEEIKKKKTITTTVGSNKLTLKYDSTLDTYTSSSTRTIPTYWFAWSAFYPHTSIVN